MVWAAAPARSPCSAAAALYCTGALIQPVHEFGLALAVRMLAFAAVAIAGRAAARAPARPRALGRGTGGDPGGADPGGAAAAARRRLRRPPSSPSEYGVSGDFYLLTNGPDGSAIAIVGDVVGHGPEAAQLATFVRARFAAFAASTSDPAELLDARQRRPVRAARAPSGSWSAPSACALRGESSSPGRSRATRRRCACRASTSCRSRARPICSAPRPSWPCATARPRWQAARASSSTPTAPPTFGAKAAARPRRPYPACWRR